MLPSRPGEFGISGRTYSDVSATDDASATEPPLDFVVVLGFGDLCLSFLEKRPSKAMGVGMKPAREVRGCCLAGGWRLREPLSCVPFQNGHRAFPPPSAVHWRIF